MTRASTTGDDKERIFIDQSLIVIRENFPMRWCIRLSLKLHFNAYNKRQLSSAARVAQSPVSASDGLLHALRRAHHLHRAFSKLRDVPIEIGDFMLVDEALGIELVLGDSV